ncbi:MAG: GatB/YqeY domain-containing protein [Candidatus Omnitrophota bacterium]
MELFKQVESDMKTALKNRDAVCLSTLRMLVTALRSRELERNDALKDEDVIRVIQKQAKQRKESIDQFAKGGRPDLAQKESAELEILERYLPRQLSPEELTGLIDQAIEESGAASPADMSKLMRAAMAKIAGRADGKEVSRIARDRLSGKMNETAGRYRPDIN